jgi:integrase
VTCNTNIAAMNAFCLWPYQEGHAAERVKLAKMRVEQRVLQLLDDAQMRALVHHKPRTFRQWRTHTAVLLILETGLRISEALNLRHADINADQLILKAFGKGQKERLVLFSPELRKRLYRFEKLKATKGIRSDWLFAGFDGTRWETRNSATSLYLMQRKLGLRDSAGTVSATPSRPTTSGRAGTSCGGRWCSGTRKSPRRSATFAIAHLGAALGELKNLRGVSWHGESVTGLHPSVRGQHCAANG